MEHRFIADVERLTGRRGEKFISTLDVGSRSRTRAVLVET